MHHITPEEIRKKTAVSHVAPRVLSFSGCKTFLTSSFFSSRDVLHDQDKMQLCSQSVHRLPTNHSLLHKADNSGTRAQE